jgi:hypothetical protein
MEICMMDTNPSSSHFYQQGIGSNQTYKNANYETIGGEPSYAKNDNTINQFQLEPPMPGPSHNIPFREPQISQQPSIQYPCENDNQHQIQPWKVESIKCEQEIDHSTNIEGVNGGDETYNSNFGGYGREPTHHSYYNNSSSSYTNPPMMYSRESSDAGNYNPYQLPATKTQLPSWYQPPSQHQPHHHYNPQQQQHPAAFYPPPNFYPQQHSYQANYIGASSSTITTEHNMRNMIQMTANR